MTPLEIEILLHYACRADDYRGGDFSAPAVRDTIDRFRDMDDPLLTSEGHLCRSQTYTVTPRGRAFVERLLTTPLPVARTVWEFPEKAA